MLNSAYIGLELKHPNFVYRKIENQVFTAYIVKILCYNRY